MKRERVVCGCGGVCILCDDLGTMPAQEERDAITYFVEPHEDRGFVVYTRDSLDEVEEVGDYEVKKDAVYAAKTRAEDDVMGGYYRRSEVRVVGGECFNFDK